MTKPKFTRGPWLADDCTIRGQIKPIAEAWPIAAIEINGDEKANAHLIAAAPEMYEMLHTASLLLSWGANVPDNLVRKLVLEGKADAITALLSKARGEAA